jgi:hypothetical protein
MPSSLINFSKFPKRLHHQLLGYIPRIRQPTLDSSGDSLEPRDSHISIIILCSHRVPRLAILSTRISSQKQNPTIHHRTRPLNPAYCDTERHLAGL